MLGFALGMSIGSAIGFIICGLLVSNKSYEKSDVK